MKTVFLAFSLILLLFPSLAAAAPFHFIVTSDNRNYRARFQHVLAEVRAHVGEPGAFVASVGDVDPVADTYADLAAAFGDGVVWHTAIGNHDFGVSDLAWLQAHNEALAVSKHPGPPACAATNYSFDVENAHLVILDEFCGRGGAADIDDPLYDWLAADLAATSQSVIIVVGHEPAYPFYRHVGESLDANPQHRDRFWSLLEQYHVAAYFCGHTHHFSAYRTGNGRVWQIDAGNSGQDAVQTFVDVAVEPAGVRFDVWSGRLESSFELIDSWSLPACGRGSSGASDCPRGDEGPPPPDSGCAATGGIGSMGVVALGLWFVVRGRRRVRPA
jgi:hypothetical protein